MTESSTTATRIAPGRSARNAALLFNYGNLAAILIPLPIGLLWLGASMIIYAMNRHHPNPRVGHYIQQAAYRFYGITGFFVAVATFIPGNGLRWYLAAWVASLLVLVPWTLLDIRRIRRETWEDVAYETEHHT